MMKRRTVQTIFIFQSLARQIFFQIASQVCAERSSQMTTPELATISEITTGEPPAKKLRVGVTLNKWETISARTVANRTIFLQRPWMKKATKYQS